jgi:hypothetical protein
MARLEGFEPTASAFAGLRSIQLSYKRFFVLLQPFKPERILSLASISRSFIRRALSKREKMPKEGFEPTRPQGTLRPERSASTVPPLRQLAI